jgi:hypothetical protein
MHPESVLIGDQATGGDSSIERRVSHARADTISDERATSGEPERRASSRATSIDLGGEHALSVLFQDHGVGLGRRGAGGLDELLENLAGGHHPALAVHPQELRVVRNEPGLDRGESTGSTIKPSVTSGCDARSPRRSAAARSAPIKPTMQTFDSRLTTFIATFAAPPGIWNSSVMSRTRMGASG